jgi:arginase
MAGTFVVVPQWQGSGSSRAMRLVDGALAIAGDLPSAATTIVHVPLEAGDELSTGVSRFSSLQAVHDRTAEVLGLLPAAAVTIGGDCGVELAPIERALTRTGGDLAVVWFDAHPDLHSSQSSPSHAFTGMVLRTLLGDGPEGLGSGQFLDPQRIVLAGVRAVDDAEETFIDESGIRSVGVLELDTPDELVATVEATGAASVYIHIDVDVLDPAEFGSKSDPVPFGITPTQLTAAIRALTARFSLAGAGITEFAPASESNASDDLPTILRIIGALTA